MAVLRMDPGGSSQPVAQVGSNTLPADSPLAGLISGMPHAGSGSAYYTGDQDPQDPPVWLGPEPLPRPGANKPLPGGGRLPAKQLQDRTLPMSQAQQFVYGMDPHELEQLTERAWYLGYNQVSAPNDVMGFINLWQQAVEDAAKFQAQGKQLSPMQVLEYGAAGNGQTRAQRALAGGVQTQKSRHIDLTDPVSAKALIRQAVKTAFGRDPTDAEIRTLTSSLTAAEKANPQVSVTSTSFDASGNPTGAPTTTTSGGLNPDAFIADQLQNDPEAKEYQAAGTYFPALMQLMGSAYGL